MQRYANLPSISVELQDGNLRIDKTPKGPVTLIVGTATDGPNETQYLVTDSNAAASIFGSTSPLIQRLSEAKLGGTKNIILYRVGGVSASINGLTGTTSEFSTKEANVISNEKYQVYIGPNPDGVTSGAVMIIFNGPIIVYSNVPTASVDSGLFNIIGFDTTTTVIVGTPTAPVELEEVIASTANSGSYAAVGDASTVAYTFYTDTSVAGTSSPTITSVKVGATVMDPSTYVLSSTGSAPTIAHILTFNVAPASLAAISIKFTHPVTVVGATYTAGADNIGCSWQKYYELLDTAYDDLETTIATEAYVDRAILDAPNRADGSSALDKLDYLNINTTSGSKVYTWSANKIDYQLGASVTQTASLADKDGNGQPIIVTKYSEVNFAHQLGTWCYNITLDDRFILASIGTSLPVTTNTAGLATWIGALPQTDYLGNITADGSGLLGNKFMTGTTTHSPGFFLTDTGLVEGNVQTDTNGHPVDLGKYISIVAGVVVTPNSATIGTIAAMVNGASIYASLVSTIAPGNSTTNTIVNGVALPFVIKKTKLDELTFAKYVTFTNTANGVSVVSGSLPTVNSDYTYISTSIIIASIVTQIRTKLQPYLGRGINQALIAAAKTAVEAILQAAVEDGAIINYIFSVLPGATVFSLSIPLKIVPTFELREVTIPISLAYNV
jgi:hypothetical protein